MLQNPAIGFLKAFVVVIENLRHKQKWARGVSGTCTYLSPSYQLNLVSMPPPSSPSGIILKPIADIVSFHLSVFKDIPLKDKASFQKN